MLKRIVPITALVLGTAAVVFWVVNLGPHGEPKPSVTDWISAVGQAVGAVGTAGALWLGAVTFRRQVQDQHRAQAAAVTVTVQTVRNNRELLEFKIQNDSPLPIYEVMLIASDRGNDVQQQFVAAMPPGNSSSFQLSDTSFTGCRATFYDSSRKRWVRDFTGHLKEITPKQISMSRRLYLYLFTHDPK